MKPTKLIPPAGVDDGQIVHVPTRGGTVLGRVEKAAGSSALVSTLHGDAWYDVSDLRVEVLVPPAEQLREFGWRELDLPRNRKRRWLRPYNMLDAWDGDPKPVTLLKACEIAGVEIH